MFSIIKRIVTFTIVCWGLLSNAQAQQKPIKWALEGGFNLPELYNYGFEVNANFYPIHALNNQLRFGPSVQAMYFFSPYKVWFKGNNNIGTGLFSEVHTNVMANLEFQPFRNNSFFIGFAPFAGWQLVISSGKMSNEYLGVDAKNTRTASIFQWGSRYKIGGFFGAKRQFGLQAHFQMSHRGWTDKDPRTGGFHIGMADYKSFVGLSFIYKLIMLRGVGAREACVGCRLYGGSANQGAVPKAQPPDWHRGAAEPEARRPQALAGVHGREGRAQRARPN